MSKKLLSLLTAISAFTHLATTQVQAQIVNKGINPSLSNPTEAASGVTFTKYFISLWNALIGIGAMMLIIYFAWAGIEWISAGGDQSKIQKARDRMTQAVVGVILLVGSYVIIGFISTIFFGNEFNILNLNIGTP